MEFNFEITSASINKRLLANENLVLNLKERFTIL